MVLPLSRESGTFVRIAEAVVRACHFHEKFGLRLDASSFRRRWPSVSSQRDRPRLPQGQKHSVHAPLLAEPPDYDAEGDVRSISTWASR
jgi:hypothetical protein